MPLWRLRRTARLLRLELPDLLLRFVELLLEEATDDED